MANEISVNATLAVRKGNLSETRSTSGSFTLNAANPAKAAGIASIGFATHEAIAIGDVATAGWARFKNVDATNYVEIGLVVSATFYPFLKLKAGEPAGPLRLGTNTIYAKANTAAVLLDYEIYDD